MFSPNTTECTFYSVAHGSSSERIHTLGHKANLCKNIAITLCILPDYTAMKVKTDTKKHIINMQTHGYQATHHKMMTVSKKKSKKK